MLLMANEINRQLSRSNSYTLSKYTVHARAMSLYSDDISIICMNQPLVTAEIGKKKNKSYYIEHAIFRFHEKYVVFSFRWVASLAQQYSNSFHICFWKTKMARHIFHRDPLIWCAVLCCVVPFLFTCLFPNRNMLPPNRIPMRRIY